MSFFERNRKKYQMRISHKFFTSVLSFGLLLSLYSTSRVQATDFPPALNYDDFIHSVQLDAVDAKLYFARQLLNVHVHVPGRDVQVRTDIVDSQGKIRTTKERVHRYKNGMSLGEIDGWVSACAGGKCLDGPNTVPLEPGVYWMVFSENGKIFSAEWFEVRAYSLGEGRFAKGQVFYSYLPQSQMARLSFESDGQFVVEAGFAGEKAVADQSSINLKLLANLKLNGQVIAKLPGKEAHRVTLYPYTTLLQLHLSGAKNNAMLKKTDLKDGNYELEIQLEGKLYRKFSFQIKAGKWVYQGRQKDNTQPPERMIVSEKSAWLWNSLSKEPAYPMPNINLTAASLPSLPTLPF
jgi:hypothetical protein